MKKKLTDILYLFSLLLFVIAFNFQHNPPSGWYQQFMPDLGSLGIRDITFTDSLNGYAITSKNVNPDTSMILKTSNGGDKWSVIYNQGSRRFSRVIFLNENTGYISGGSGTGIPYLFKTTDGATSWSNINLPGLNFIDDVSILNEDTIWIVDDNGLNGGIFRTTNSGINWEVQYGGTLGGNKPDKIYMHNRNFGFAGRTTSSFLWRTTNSGLNWTQVPSENGFRDMYFADSLTGWKALNRIMKKSIDGGQTWIEQSLPTGGMIRPTSGIHYFSNVNKDTIHGIGGSIVVGFNEYRAIIYTTHNGGDLWMYQIPDTTFGLLGFGSIDFINHKTGWAYLNDIGIHTKTGGDTTFYTGIVNISSEIPSDFKLHQNYPNPFNPRTVIRYELTKSADVTLKVYDVTGRENMTLVNQFQQAGVYEVDYMGKFSSSGVYFYRLDANGELVDTKKMLMIK